MALRDEGVAAIALDTLSKNNDLGKPWRYIDEDTGYTVTRSCIWSPPGCHPVGCGIKYYTDENGKLVKVEGDENHPVTQGRLCPRCIALKDYEHNPSRILHPMKRARADRGKADAWERITWKEAMEIIGDNYRRLTAQYGKETVVVLGGTGREGGTTPYGPLAFETPNHCYAQSGYACYFPRLAAGAMIAGLIYPELDYAACLPGRYDDSLYEVPEVVIEWGKMPLASNPDGFFGHAIIDLMKRGTKVIMIDSRVNWLCTRAAYHLQIRPGTDTALGMAMLDVIISEDLYDHEFVDQWCYGFGQLAERVSEMPPEKAAEICGVNAEDIVGAARLYANATPAAIQWGLATDQKANGSQQAMCIVDLMAITGNIDRPGGQVVAGASQQANTSQESDDEALPYMGLDDQELEAKRIGLKEYPCYVGLSSNSHADMTLKCMETDEPYPLRFGMHSGSNVLSCTTAEPKRWEKAINRALEFCFGFDCFMTPTIQATCDLVLPLAAGPERESTVPAQYGMAPIYTGAQNKAVDEEDCRSDVEFLLMLGKEVNPDKFDQYDDFEKFLEHMRLSSKTPFKKLKENVVLQSQNEYYKYKNGKMRPDGNPGFNTPSGRVELYSGGFAQFGDDPLPYYEEPEYSPVNSPEIAEKYPFVLTTGARAYAFFHSEHRQIPYLRELNPDPIVEINPADARRLGIMDGQWCRIFNQFGEVYQKAKVSQIIKSGVVNAQHGWWFPEADPNNDGEFGPFDVYRSNVNSLIPNFHNGKLGFGAPFKGILCNIEPTDRDFDTDMGEIWEKFKERA